MQKNNYLYWEGGGLQIYCGDFQEIFLGGHIKSTINFVCTDPPYNIDFGKYDGYKDTMPDEKYIEMFTKFKNIPSAISTYPEEMMKYIVPALGVPDEVMAWCYNSNINRRFRLINCYGRKPDYSKVKQPYKNPTDKRVAKLIESGSKGTNLYDWFSDIQLVKNVSKEKTEHPCPVPEKLVERILMLMTTEKDTVLDPFMGSGTTLVSARNLNRRAIGIEINEKYCEIAKKRILCKK